MAQVIGYLRQDRATWGEKQVLAKLSKSLPQDFYVYIECPLQDREIERFPDFIVLTTFGVVVLEVKDWVEIVQADKFWVKVRTRAGRIDQHKNPVRAARGCATILADKLQRIPELLGERRRLKVPWGYAVVLPHQPTSIRSRLGEVWGRAQVLGLPDLEPRVVTQCLKATLPRDYVLRHEDLRYVKSVINPVVLIAPQPKRHAIVLDQEQEQIVVEAPRAPAQEGKAEAVAVERIEQATFAPVAEPETETVRAEDEAASLPTLEGVAHNASIRLVRGVAGSGKTLVLTQRARYLAAQYPEWRFCVLTFNKRLATSLRASLKGLPNVKVAHFHQLCAALLRGYNGRPSIREPDGWLKRRLHHWPVARDLGAEYVSDEIRWIKEADIHSRETYLEIERKGRGQGLKRGGRQRAQIYEVYEAYNAWLKEQGACDWGDIPYLVLRGIDEGRIEGGCYDAILIDEAQDFAPSWIRVVTRLLPPDGGLIFMTDDPSQSIYRFYSWREKGVPVVGRTRWLRVPYRNTRQIYQAAYEVIREDDLLKHILQEQFGTALEPDLSGEYLRSGTRPTLRQFHSLDEEGTFIRSEVEWLLQKGFDASEMVVLHRRTSGVRKLAGYLRGLGVEATTFHAPKGLEFEVVFLSQMQATFPGGLERSEQALSDERRLVYMAMTRARERLYLSYERQWPAPLKGMLGHVDRVLVQ